MLWLQEMQNFIGNLFIIITTAISVASLFLGLFAYNKKNENKSNTKNRTPHT